jgi:hypothetical protein
MSITWSTDLGVTWKNHLPVWGGGSGYSCLSPIKPLDKMGFGVLGLVYEKGPNAAYYWHTVSFARIAYIKKMV